MIRSPTGSESVNAVVVGDHQPLKPRRLNERDARSNGHRTILERIAPRSRRNVEDVVPVALDPAAHAPERRARDGAADGDGVTAHIHTGTQEQVSAHHHHVSVHVAREIGVPAKHDQRGRDRTVAWQIEAPIAADHHVGLRDGLADEQPGIALGAAPHDDVLGTEQRRRQEGDCQRESRHAVTRSRKLRSNCLPF